jgi:hypothetical protein
MAFWSIPKAGQDPKRAFRFRLEFGGDIGFVWYAKTVDRPSYTIETGEHKFLNHTFYYPGHVTWQEVTATLVDPSGENDVALMMNKLVELSGYGPPESKDDLTTIGKHAAVNHLQYVKIEMLDSGEHAAGGASAVTEGTPNAKAVETWILRNAWISGITHSQLDYSSDDLSTIEIKFRYDWAEFQGADGTKLFAG